MALVRHSVLDRMTLYVFASREDVWAPCFIDSPGPFWAPSRHSGFGISTTRAVKRAHSMATASARSFYSKTAQKTGEIGFFSQHRWFMRQKPIPSFQKEQRHLGWKSHEAFVVEIARKTFLPGIVSAPRKSRFLLVNSRK